MILETPKLRATFDSSPERFPSIAQSWHALPKQVQKGVRSSNPDLARLLDNSVHLQKAADRLGYDAKKFSDLYKRYLNGTSKSESFEAFVKSPTLRNELELAEGANKARVPFPKGGTANQNFAQAVVELEKMPSYAKYANMLEKEGIATRAAIQTELEALIKARGAKGFSTVDDLRHAFKEKFRARVLAKMTKSTMTAEEKHQAFLRITEQLSSGDKGSLAEAWYKLTYSPKSTSQVPFTKESMAKQGIDITGRQGGDLRYADLVDGNRVREIKHVSGSLSAEELEQFSDYIKIAAKRGSISKDGQKFTVERITYVFANPDGVKANSVWIGNAFRRDRDIALTFEVFNLSGERLVVTRGNYAKWFENLDGWLKGEVKL